MKDYNNFQQDLNKEKDKEAQANLLALYKKYFHKWEVIDIDYDSPYGQLLQSAGVDKAFVKRNKYGGIPEQKWIQEKIVFSDYPNFMFEYEKKSGAKGWALCPNEKADFLVYYMAGTIYIMDFKELRAWLTANLEGFKRKYAFKTDNYNVNVPKHIVKANIKVWEYRIQDYKGV